MNVKWSKWKAIKKTANCFWLSVHTSINSLLIIGGGKIMNYELCELTTFGGTRSKSATQIYVCVLRFVHLFCTLFPSLCFPLSLSLRISNLANFCPDREFIDSVACVSACELWVGNELSWYTICLICIYLMAISGKLHI